MTLQAAPIIAAVEDVIHRGHGNQHVITASTFGRDAYDGLSGFREAVASFSTPQAEVEVRSVERHESAPLQPSDFTLYRVELEVRLVRTVRLRAQLSSASRSTLKAALLLDGPTLARALTWPSNLTTDADSNQTLLAGGRLKWDGSDTAPFDFDSDNINGRVVTVHRFSAVAEGT